MNVNEIIKYFSDFLNVSWNCAIPLLSERAYTSNEDSINDWMQANWELLVERKILPLNEYLEVYGDGADFNGVSSRITDMNRVATYYLSVSIYAGVDLLTNEKVNNSIFLFEKFVGFKAGFYTVAPPFKYVLVLDSNDVERVFHIESTIFELYRKI